MLLWSGFGLNDSKPGCHIQQRPLAYMHVPLYYHQHRFLVPDICRQWVPIHYNNCNMYRRPPLLSKVGTCTTRVQTVAELILYSNQLYRGVSAHITAGTQVARTKCLTVSKLRQPCVFSPVSPSTCNGLPSALPVLSSRSFE